MGKRHQIILHLGSNKGQRVLKLQAARQQIAQKVGKIVKSSGLYETEAWGLENQARFLNQALLVTTKLAAMPLLDAIQEIENELGRIRKEKWGPRVIDIDILFFDNEIINTNRLTVPHPLIQDRNFVLYPLNEIAGKFRHPKLKKTVSALLEACTDKQKVNFI